MARIGQVFTFPYRDAAAEPDARDAAGAKRLELSEEGHATSLEHGVSLTSAGGTFSVRVLPGRPRGYYDIHDAAAESAADRAHFGLKG